MIVSPSLAKPPLLSVPGPGRTLGAAVEPIGSVLRSATADVAQTIDAGCLDAYTKAFGPRDAALADSRDVTPVRAARALIGTWCVARVVVADQRISLDEAEAFFFGDQSLGLARFVPPPARLEVESALRHLDRQAIQQLLPYVLDRHSPGTRRSVLKDPDEAATQSARRRHGIYYTPGDVADYMVDWVLSRNDDGSTPLLDPACGTGVFLLAAASRLAATMLPEKVLARLYGIDRDPLAVDAACFVLTAGLADRAVGIEPWRLWHLARLNFAERDALGLTVRSDGLWPAEPDAGRLEMRRSLRDRILREPRLPDVSGPAQTNGPETVRTLFPEGVGPWHVVANPPYAPIGDRADIDSMAHRFGSLAGSKVTASTSAFVPFMDYMWSLGRGEGRSSMVVPLSIAYNSTTPFRALRRTIGAVRGEWTFRFFDRTPDALFGDDIKQRAAIACRDATVDDCRLLTSGFLRWTSRQRANLFSSLPVPVRLDTPDITPGIPKVGTQWEIDLLRRLRCGTDSLARVLTASDNDGWTSGTVLAVGTTAYNHLVLYRHGLHSPDGVTANLFVARSTDDADWVYALLASGVAYWLWRVEGDGFHVPASWISEIPVVSRDPGFVAQLGALGKDLWTKTAAAPTVAVNGGRRTVSYRPPRDRLVLDIDRLLSRALGLGEDTADRLAAFTAETISVGREEPD